MSNLFYFQPGPAGSGKTYQLAHWATERVSAGEKVIIAQPTKVLLKQTMPMLRAIDASTRLTMIAGKGRQRRVAARILAHMVAASPMQGEVLLITHEALRRLPPNMRRHWHMVCDEVPPVLDHIDLKVAQTHHHITAHIDAAEELVAGLTLLRVGDRSALEAVAINATGDQNIASFRPLANAILSDEHIVVVDTDSYRDLIENPGTRGKLNVFALRLPDFAEGYRSTTFMGANIEDSEMFVVWDKICDVRWRLHPQMGGKLRYTEHQNGSRLTISYLFEHNLSRYFLDQEDEDGGTNLDQVNDYVARFWSGIPFLWQVNADVAPDDFDPANRLPGVAHGLNRAHWMGCHHVALLAALNRKTPAYGFLAKIGVSSEQAQATVSYQNDYQAMMRCSLRDPAAVANVHVIVGTRAGAEWIAARFPGCVVEKLDHGIDEPRPRGRPRKNPDLPAKTSAERGRERRARIRAEKENA